LSSTMGTSQSLTAKGRASRQNISEATFQWTLARFPYYEPLGWPRGILKVNSLARINMCKDLETEKAGEAIRDMRGEWGHPIHNNLLFDYARLIELVYASERTIQLLEDESLTDKNVRIPIAGRSGEGAGSVEAPRGTLVHSYRVDDNARLSYVDIIVPTESNNAAINMAIKDVASQCISAGQVRSDLYRRVETTIRAFDTCISCAHHKIEIVRAEDETETRDGE